MKKRTTKLLALLLVTALLCGLMPASLSVAAGDNLLANGDFESGNSGWTVPAWCSSAVMISAAHAKEGRLGVGLSGGWANVTQTVAVKPNTDYVLSFWVKGYAVVYFKTTDNAEIHTVWPSEYSEWTQVSYAVNVNSNTAVYIEINCGEQTASVDSVVFAEQREPTFEEAGKLINGDFETGDKTGWSGNFKVTAAARRQGNYGASVSGGGWDQLNQLVSVQKNTSYRISFYYKGQFANYVKYDTSGGEIIWDHAISGERPYAADWTYYEFTVPSGGHTMLYIEFSANQAASGFCLDDVKMAPIVDNFAGGGLGSVTEEDGTIGVAFRFDLKAQVTAEGNDFVGGTVAPMSNLNGYTLVRMGAVITNDKTLSADLSLDCVNGSTCRDVPAAKVMEVTAEQVSYAVRIVNIPKAAKGFTLYARAYYIYDDGTEQTVVYSPTVCEESYNTIVSRENYTDSSRWELYWNDEFGGQTLDTTKWNAANTSGTFANTDRPENVKVEDGSLVLTARKENYNGSTYTTANMTSDYKFSVLYGRIEIRAKLAWGRGLWPALWTMGDLYLERGDTDGWPYAGEIDILELVGEADITEVKKWPWSEPTYEYTSNKNNEANRTATHNLHWGLNRDQHRQVGSYTLDGYDNRFVFPEDDHPADGYHVYAIEWRYRDITFFVDDVAVSRVWWDDTTLYWQNEGAEATRCLLADQDTTAEALDIAFCNEDNPHWLIMGLGLCEGWGNMANQVDGSDMPANMYIDYVRVYKEKE